MGNSNLQHVSMQLAIMRGANYYYYYYYYEYTGQTAKADRALNYI